MDVGSRVPVKLATREALDSLDSLRLVSLSSGIGLEVDNRTPKVLVMDFSGMSSQGNIQNKVTLNSKELAGYSSNFKPVSKIVGASTNSNLDFLNTDTSKDSQKGVSTKSNTISQAVPPVSAFGKLVEENKKNQNKTRHSWFFSRRKKTTESNLNNKNIFKNESQILSEKKSFGVRLLIRIKQIIAHSIDICIVFNFSLLVIGILSMIIWGIYPSDIITSPIIAYILQMRWIEFMFWIYVGFFVYRYLFKHLIGATLGSKLCFGRRTKSVVQKT